MTSRVAVVTGANRGLGFAIVKELCKKFDGDVYLTARDPIKGQSAVKDLEKDGLSPKFYQLDVGDHDSIVKLHDHIQTEYGGLDLLVNNAGVMHDERSTLSYVEQVKDTINTNYFAVLDSCQVLYPLLRPHARVVHMGSMAANFAIKKCSPEMHAKFTNPDITMEDLSALMKQFIQAAESKKLSEMGFDDNVYGISKIGLHIMASIQQKELDKEGREDVVVNACSPGYVKTDMTNHKGHLSLEEGIITPVYLSLLPPNITSPRGLFVRLLEPVDWANV